MDGGSNRRNKAKCVFNFFLRIMDVALDYEDVLVSALTNFFLFLQ